MSFGFRCLALNVNWHVSLYRRSNPYSLVESLCPTLSVCRLILSDHSLHCNRHINNSVRVLILQILMCSVSFCLVCSVSWLIFSGVRGIVPLHDLLDGPGVLFDSGTESTTYSFTATLPCDRRAAPLPCNIPGGFQHLVNVPHVCLDACLLKARLSQGLSSVWRSSVVEQVVGHPRPSLSGTGVPWVSLPGPTGVPQSPG